MLRVYFKLKEQYLKTAMEYKANFWIMIFSGVLMRGLMMAGAFVIYRNVPTIAGFKEAEVYLIMSFMFLTEGFCNLFFNGIWHLAMLVFSGELDTMLVKPVSPFFQVLAHEFGLQGIGVVALGLFGFFSSLAALELLTLKNTLLGLLFMVTGTVFRLSVNIISGSLVFFTEPMPTDPMFLIYSFGENARYPVSIYPLWMKIILLFVIPFGFIGYIPALIYRGEQSLLLLLGTILFSAVFFMFSRFLFNKGVRKYESMGM